MDNERPSLAKQRNLYDPRTVINSIFGDLTENQQESVLLNPANIYKYLPSDMYDYFMSPDYRGFKLPYHIRARNRYSHTRKLFDTQINKEIMALIEHLPSSYEAVRFTKHLSYTTFWPPYHSRAEEKKTHETFYTLTPTERQRVEFLMSTKVT